MFVSATDGSSHRWSGAAPPPAPGHAQIRASVPRPLLRRLSPYEAAADVKRFLVRATPNQAPQPLTLIVNWPALMKKGSGAQ
ncbi:MAG: hypothetical protein ACRD8O_16605 [Bryobacteraceae bacterium]